MTSSLLIVALLGIGFLCAHLGRTAVLLALSYLALRRSEPDERKEILEALGPVLNAVGATEPRTPALPADQRPVCPRYTNTASDALYLNDTSRGDRADHGDHPDVLEAG